MIWIGGYLLQNIAFSSNKNRTSFAGHPPDTTLSFMTSEIRTRTFDRFLIGL
uniref:Uncharacterized protein n=1 Tax=Meloidogyne enterolobii TaxID=390850 RepID=A0A6V7TSW8_MELEN|nr:unnamed protein product [Meloidogyne enterolobii]